MFKKIFVLLAAVTTLALVGQTEKKAETPVSNDKRIYQQLVEQLKTKEKLLNDKEQELELLETKLKDFEAFLKKDWEKLKQAKLAFSKEIEKEKEKRNTLFVIPAQQLQIYNSMKAEPMASNLLELYKKDRKMCFSIVAGMEPKKAAKVMNILATKAPEAVAGITKGIGLSKLP